MKKTKKTKKKTKETNAGTERNNEADFKEKRRGVRGRWRGTANPLRLLLASLEPLLEQVLVVAVGAGPQGVDAAVGELAAVGVDEHGHQAVVLPLQLVHHPGHLVHHLLQPGTTKRLPVPPRANSTAVIENGLQTRVRGITAFFPAAIGARQPAPHVNARLGADVTAPAG